MYPDKFAEILDKLDNIAEPLEKYYNVHCGHCEWSHDRWTEAEVCILGQIHEDRHEEHITFFQPMVFGNKTSAELGFDE